MLQYLGIEAQPVSSPAKMVMAARIINFFIFLLYQFNVLERHFLILNFLFCSEPFIRDKNSIISTRLNLLPAFVPAFIL
jgi:hypothetical protein